MILTDTNILTRSAQPGHSLHAVAKESVKRVRTLGYTPCIVPQVLYEFWVVATRPLAENGLGMTAQETEADILNILETFHLFRDERAIFGHWQNLVAKYQVMGKVSHDARLVAAMQRHGITHLLTFNEQHFRRFSGIIVVNPANVSRLTQTRTC